jgi:predicted XRE-type DNA-binding protein
MRGIHSAALLDTKTYCIYTTIGMRLKPMKRSSDLIGLHTPAPDLSLNRQTKLRLAKAINEALQQQRMSQSDAATLLGIPQPKVSALANYRLDGFSVQRLFRLLNALGRDVLIQISKKKPGSIGKTSVTAA